MASILLLLSCTWLVFLGRVVGQPLSLSDCTDGFINQDLSTALQSGSLTIPYEQQRIIPGISFNCSGAITSWTIGAEWRTGGMHNFFPHLQIWRNASICGANAYILVGDTELFVPDRAGLVTQNDYVFTGTADPVLEFQAGDILGLFQPRESRSRVRVYYDTSAGPTNYYIADDADQPSLTSFVITNADGMEDHLPLVTIEIGPSTAEPIEVDDYELLNETEVTTTLQSTSLTIPYEQQRIIPGIPLNCSGTTTSWTIGAEWRTGGMHNFFPHLQLWRSIVDGCSYTLVGDTQLFVPDSGELVTQTDYVFSGTPAPAVGFQAGDILGLFQPRESRSRVRVYYDTSTGPTNYYNDIGNADEPPSIQDQEDFLIITADGMENGLPLLAIEITIDCDPLANPENGAVVITTIASDSLTAIYSCSPGYELAGEEVRDCNCQNTGGVWIGMPPTCMLIDCGGLTVPMDGQLTFTPGVVESVDTGLNATATYTCSEGYSLVGDAMRTCQADSQWDGVEPICTLIDCGGLTDPESGQVTISPGIVVTTGLNAVAMYTCNDGYDLVGDTMRTCQSDAQWNGTEPVCMIIDCGGLTDPESGQVTISPGVIVTIDTGLDAVAAYSCNVGYDLVGAEMRTCQSGSQWDGAEPTCMARSGICILGSTEVPETNFLDESGSQYLDFGNPAACNGNLTAWHFCYYAADIDQSDTYVVFFRVWRASEGNSFDLIDTYTLSMAIDPPSNGPTLICENVTLSTPLDIQRNDILGVYTPALLVRPLHIVARDTTTNFGIFADTRGAITAFLSQSTTTDNLENRTTLGLHLYADIVIICDDLPDPADGQVTFTPGVVVTIDTGLGAVATYTCTEGYSLVGDAIRTCQETGQWNGAEPTCLLIDCGNLNDPESGQVMFTSGVVTTIQTGLDAIANYSCSEGYDLVGDAMRTCQETGQWNGAEPTCMLIDCGNLTDPEGGQIMFTPGVVATTDSGLDAVATYSCNEGYNLTGDGIRTCQESGQWNGPEPTCMLIDCDTLTDPESGHVTFTPGVVAMIQTGLDAIATYTCIEGYSLVGNAMRTCQETGQWNGAEPNCVLIDCGNLTDPEGGQITFTPGVVATTDSGLDAVATYSCNEGYNLTGDEIRTCQGSGQWDGTAPNCILIDCGGLTDPEGGHVTFTPGVITTIDTGLGAVATYSCNASAGFFYIGLSSARTCQDNGLWSGMAEICTRCDFNALTDPENGGFGITTIGGDITASYICNMGYQLVGDEFITCQSTGEFSGQEPICSVIDCGNLTDPEGGQVTFTPGVVTTIDTGLDAVAAYTCDQGYDLVGDEMRTCQTNELWDGAEPNCTLIDCGNLTDPENGQVTFTPGVVATTETGLNAIATYACSEGYNRIGDEMRTCQENSVWDGAAPVCMLIDCDTLNDPENGQITFTPGVVATIQTGLDAVANYTCGEGYDLVGDEMRTCQTNGQWTGTEPNCMLTDCGNLTDPEGGQIMFTPGVVATTDSGLDAVATYSCNVGYNLTGDGIRTCQGNGQWDGAAPNCILIDCGGLTDPEGGQVTFTSGVVTTIDTGLDAVAAYTCDQGYDLVGDEMRTCQTNEQWTGAEPNCMLIDCGNLTDPESGQVTFTPGVVTTIDTGLDAVAAYTCDQGYDLVGDEMRTCQTNELWDGAEPNCTLIDCGNLTDPENGQVTFTPGVVATTETGLNAIATYACSEGYNRVGDEMRTCQENSIWDGAAPVCMLIDCDTLNDPENGQVTFTPGVVATIQTGLDAVANYTCGEGYDLVGDEMRTCQTNGQWTGTEPNCMLIDCGNLTDPEGGQIMFTPGVVATTDSGLDAVATYSCNAGYNLTGDGIRTCQGNGQWDGAAPNCILIDCGNLTDPESGQVTFTPGVVTTIDTGLDAVAAYTCNQGYDLVGDEMRTCQENQQWTVTEPNCMLIDCGGLTDPEGGQVTFTPGVVATIDTGLFSVAAYTCNQGYDLVGGGMRTCQANGQWTVTEPNCMLIDCGGLTDPEGGQVTFTPGVVATTETGLDAVATYTCSEGYDLGGNETRSCQANSQWNGAEPICTLIDCGNLPNPENGLVTITPGVVAETGVGALATYTCSEGYELIGNGERTCQDTGDWNQMAPTCMLIDCGNLEEPENGTVTINPGVVPVAPTGLDAVATYACNDGSNLIGSATRTCQPNGDWDGAEPTCISGPLPTSTQILDRTPSQTPTPPPTDSSTTVASSTGPQTGSNIGLVAGAAAGGAIGILVVVVAAIILVLLYRRHKRGIYKIPYGQPQDDHILANPLYQAPTEARGQDMHGFKNPLYQVPGAGDDNTLAIKRLANTQLNAMDLDGDYEDIGGEIEHYELAPLASPAVKMGFVDNPVYGGAEIGATTKFNLSSSLEASMEWGIRVPTQELRNSLERSKPVEGNPYAVYSTLLECSEQTKETQEAEQQEFFQEEDIYWVPASTSEDLYSQLAQRKYREILRNQITLGEKLGAGQFGTVNKGAWQSPDGPVKVAVKTLKEGASEQDRVKFLQEAAISGQFHHPNVITLHGVVTVGEPAMLILELMSESDMRVFFIQERPRLQEAAPPEVAKLCLEFCQQIASGMEYLSRKAFIHRDLAARNILLSKNRICKIADFGMARDLEDENYYIAHGGQIPVKWTAPEALNFKKFSTASDVWSFGVLMYEIWSLGHKPFEGYTNQQAMLMIAQSQRLPPPPGCPKAIYSTMIKCWHPETSSRPTFTDLQQILSDTDNLLSWSEEDTKVHPQAAVLGAPLDAGKNLYPELQRTYM